MNEEEIEAMRDEIHVRQSFDWYPTKAISYMLHLHDKFEELRGLRSSDITNEQIEQVEDDVEKQCGYSRCEWSYAESNHIIAASVRAIVCETDNEKNLI